MTIKGNKGEWSEFYVFLKILVDKKLFAADENLQVLTSIFYPVFSVFRNENGDNELVYDIESSPGEVLIKNVSGNIVGVVESQSISSKLAGILRDISAGGSGGSFSVPSTSLLMSHLNCRKIKAGSAKKEDVVVLIDDCLTGRRPKVGFSIKSQLGGSSTLLNASTATNIVYSVKRGRPGSGYVSSSAKLAIPTIYSRGETIEYKEFANTTFAGNATLVDSAMCRILAEMVKAYFEGRARKISDLVDYLVSARLPNNIIDPPVGFLKHKIQDFLQAVALGMQPASVWDGLTKATGGYLILKSNGELVCYHLYNLNKFRDYLYENTRLETASTSRHGFGTEFVSNGKKNIKLNLQIRFN